MGTFYRYSKKFGLGLMALIFACIFGLSSQVAAAGASKKTFKKGVCISATLPVALGADQPTGQKVHGTYCQPFKWAKGTHQIDVLTEGSTYNASYWDWPVNPKLYSYVDKTLEQGRATLAYDRMGAGKSSHPLSTDITQATDGYVLHRIVQLVRALGYKQVNSIGHSYGSGIALEEAATYGDVNRLVLTGFLHQPSNPVVVAGNYPANQDPAFADKGLDDGYLTSKPGARQTSFYSASADPAVIAYDEAHKDLVSRTGLLDFVAKRGVPASSNMSNQVKTPVLLISGDLDTIFCYNPATLNCADTAAVAAHETPYYTSAASMQVSMVANTGHDLALHPSANQSFKIIDQWIKAH
jgi:pimeloyl-ACP methyl ester carboxylesterase